MRDPARIDQELELVRRVWMRSPDLRVGQLIVTAVQPHKPCSQVHAIEDTMLARRLERMLKREPGPRSGE
jgi:hypothetical protein